MKINGNRGTILMLVVISAFILSIVGLGTINLMGMQEIQARAELDIVRARNLADAGIEYGKVWISSACLAGPAIESFPENVVHGFPGRPGDSAYTIGQVVYSTTKLVGSHGSIAVTITPDDSNNATIDLKYPWQSTVGTYIVSSTGTALSGAGNVSLNIRKTFSIQRSKTPEFYAIDQDFIPSGLFPRGAATVTMLDNGKVLVAGGNNVSGADYHEGAPGGTTLATAFLFDPALNNGRGGFTATNSNMTRAREEHTATLIPSTGKVLISGGRNETSTPINTLEYYDPVSNTFATIPGAVLSEGKFCHVAVLLSGTTEVLIMGGRTPGGAELDTADIFNVGTGAMVNAAGALLMNTSRHCFSAAAFSDGVSVFFAGGNTGSGMLQTSEIFTRFPPQFSFTDNMHADKRYDPGLIRLADDRMLLIGGHYDFDDTVEIYDRNAPAGSRWIQVTDRMNRSRADMFYGYVEDGTPDILIMGGVFAKDNQTATIERFHYNHANPARSTFETWDTEMLEAVEAENNAQVRLPNGSYFFAGGWANKTGSTIAQVLSYPLIFSPVANTYTEGASTRN